MDVLKELEKLQVELLNLEREQSEKRAELEISLLQKWQPVVKRRRDIILGSAVPSEAEIGPDPFESNAADPAVHVNEKGIPNFWLKVLNSQDVTASQVQKHDEPALQQLQEIEIQRPSLTEYRISFHFAPNDFFTERTLVKEVHTPSTTAPLSSAVVKESSVVHWKKDMNLTVRQVIKKGKGFKGKDHGTAEQKLKSCPSFFTFFSSGVDGRENERHQGSRSSALDLETFRAIWMEVVPNAIELYLSEAAGNDGLGSVDADEYEPIKRNDEGQSPDVQHRIRALQYLHQKRSDLGKEHRASLAQLAEGIGLRSAAVCEKRRSLIVGPKAESTRKWEDMALPRFWLLALKGCDVTVELVRKRDEGPLSYLTDVCCRHISTGFKVDFEFMPNPYFTNKVLSKTYFTAGDEQTIVKSEGTGIDWHEEKDVTVNRVTSEAPSGKTYTKTKPCPSFFWLFCNEGGQRLFAGGATAHLSGPALRDAEVSLALALRDTLVPHALAMYHDAAQYDMADSEGSDDEEDEGLDSESDVDRRAMSSLPKGRRRKRKGEENDKVCCGLTKGQVLVVLVLSLVLAEVVLFVDMLGWGGR